MMPAYIRNSLVAVLALLVTLSWCDTAWAQTRIDTVSVEVIDLMGGECSRSWGTLRISVTNRTPRRMSGAVGINLWGSPREQVTEQMSLPAEGVAQFDIVMPPNWCGVQACFKRDGETEGCSGIGATWPSERGDRNAEVLVLQQELELRPALSVATVRNERRDAYSPHSQEAPGRRPPMVAFAVLEGLDAHPSLPDRTVGYNHLRMVMAEAAMLDTLSPEQAFALDRWVQTGGELTVVARSANDFAKLSLVRSLVPGLVPGRGDIGAVFSEGLDFVATEWDDGAASGELRRSLSYECPNLEITSYGSRALVGLGSVHFVLVSGEIHDGLGPARVVRDRHALDDLLDWAHRFRSFGWGGVNVDTGTSGALPRYTGSYDSPDEREAARILELDPNLNNRLPIWSYLLVVLVFTTLLFWLQHRWSRKGGRVWRMLAITAAMALTGCLLVFALSWAARGTGAKYCSMAWVETATGSPHGVMWRRLALASDQAGIRTLPLEQGLEPAAPGNELHGSGEERELRFEASRWETVLAAEHGVIDLDGTIELTWVASSPTTVSNTFSTPLRDAVLVVGSSRYWLGTVGAGEQVDVDPDMAGGSFPVFAPDHITQRAQSGPMTAAVVGKLDLGCPDRGEFTGERCYTTIVVWGRP